MFRSNVRDTKVRNFNCFNKEIHLILYDILNLSIECYKALLWRIAFQPFHSWAKDVDQTKFHYTRWVRSLFASCEISDFLNTIPFSVSSGVVATVTIAFIMVGDINFLAPIVTMPFLLTYACIDYSYFALAQTFDIQTKREERFRIQAQSPSYESRRYGAVEHENDNDLDHLFPERTRHKLGVSVNSIYSILELKLI